MHTDILSEHLCAFFRLSEGVEHYLDLLAILHSEEQHRVRMKMQGLQNVILLKLPLL